jgi:putative cell wall-binding protein
VRPVRRALLVPVLIAATSLAVPAAAEAQTPSPGPAMPPPVSAQVTVAPAPAVAVSSVAPTVRRLSGQDRYATAAAISRAAFPHGAVVVYVATGRDFPDGLSGGAAAAHEGGPLLLVTKTTVPDVIATELQRLGPDRIVVQGGGGVISTETANRLASLTGAQIVRNAGTDRVDTALRTSRRAFADGADVVYLAVSTGFPDALGGGAAAAHEDGPLLLVPPGDTLPAAVEDEIARLGATTVRILGGPGVISPQVERRLRGTVPNVERFGGADRYGTASITADMVFDSASHALIATGQTFPDGLAGGPLAAVLDGPIFFVPTTCVPRYVLDELAILGVTKVTVLGGTGAVGSGAASLSPCDAPRWLTKTNGWRADYGVGSVHEDPWLSGNIAAHVFYMLKTGEYGHTENPSSPWYTPNGELGGLSDLALGATTPDDWMAAPFHAVSLLDPLATTAGYYTNIFAGETTAGYGPVDPSSVTWPKTWPSARRSVTMTTLTPEWPDPTSGCPAAYHTDPYWPSAGLPLIASFGPDAPVITSATATLTRNGSPLPVCVVTESNYTDSDADAQLLGRAILNWNHHVFTIPRDPLRSGSYALTVTTNAGTATTTFVVP